MHLVGTAEDQNKKMDKWIGVKYPKLLELAVETGQCYEELLEKIKAED